MSSYASLFLSTSAGLVAGLCGALTIQALHDNRPQKPMIVTEEAPVGATPGEWVNEAAEGRLRSLEERMLLLQQSKRQAPDDTREGEHVTKPTPEELEQASVELDPAWGHQRAIQRWNQTLAAFEADPVDPSWAAGAAEDFSGDLLPLSETAGFRVDSAECRTTKCAVKTTWPNHAEATAGFAKLLHHRYTQNCGKEVTLPQPSAGTENEPYAVTVIFDCTDARSGS